MDNDQQLIWEAYIDKHGNFRGGKDPNKKPEEGGATYSPLDATKRPSLKSDDPNERARAAEYETRHISPKPERDRQRKKLGEDVSEDDVAEMMFTSFGEVLSYINPTGESEYDAGEELEKLYNDYDPTHEELIKTRDLFEWAFEKFDDYEDWEIDAIRKWFASKGL